MMGLARNVAPINKWFKLEVDHAADSMEVIASAGCDQTVWSYRGPAFPRKLITYPRVKLVELGVPITLTTAKERAASRGWRLLEGQACNALRKIYPYPFQNTFAVFGGSEWLNEDDVEHIVYMEECNDSWNIYCTCSYAEWGHGTLWAVTETP